MDNHKILVGSRINAALTKQGKTQKELAEHLGVMPNVISYFCKGERTPNTEQIVKICHFLDVSADYLLGLSSIESTDADMQLVHKVTGLSEKAVEVLHHEFTVDPSLANVYNFVFESNSFYVAIETMLKYARLEYYTNKKNREKSLIVSTPLPDLDEPISDEEREIKDAEILLEDNGCVVLNSNYDILDFYLQKFNNLIFDLHEDVGRIGGRL